MHPHMGTISICLKFVRNIVDPTSADDIKFRLPGVMVVFVHETIGVMNKCHYLSGWLANKHD